MINERDIAEKFSAVWKSNFPLLTPNFIRVYNETQVIKINTNSILKSGELRYDLVSEVAFNISAEIYRNECKVEEFLTDIDKMRLILRKVVKLIWRSEGDSGIDVILSNDEEDDVKKITENILEFLNKFSGDKVEFKPEIKGFGFIPKLEADLSIGTTLFEIKTVTRNFKSSDFKQLFLYLALRQVSNQSNWEYAGLYNPRRGVYCRFHIGNMVSSLSGNKTPNEAFDNLLNSLVRDVEIDTKF
ncbi:hypothetical protein AB9P05_04915 [Roseivirga sp. BDSF3-8]|uniref:hypothetical protein n=1 Tax=Roseivirga sp. BDSF3-8 TaxID=3241598 RepID=UPI003531F78B